MADVDLVNLIYRLLSCIDPGTFDAERPELWRFNGEPLTWRGLVQVRRAGPDEWAEVKRLAELDWDAAGEVAPWRR